MAFHFEVSNIKDKGNRDINLCKIVHKFPFAISCAQISCAQEIAKLWNVFVRKKKKVKAASDGKT